MPRPPAENAPEPSEPSGGSPGSYWGQPSAEDAQRVLPVSEWHDAEPWRTTETVKPSREFL